MQLEWLPSLIPDSVVQTGEIEDASTDFPRCITGFEEIPQGTIHQGNDYQPHLENKRTTGHWLLAMQRGNRRTAQVENINVYVF